jgi:dimethylargininase
MIAITRQVSPAMTHCELTHLPRQIIDIPLASRQHQAYEKALTSLGCTVQSLPAEPALPDSVFVEDAAVVFAEAAIITRPGAISRRPETESIARALLPYRLVRSIESPGTLDGGDVLCVGKKVFIGLSSRSNASAIYQMQSILSPFGYTVQGVGVSGFLHLKSAVTQIAPNMLLINPAWVDGGLFGAVRIVEIDPGEPYAANGLWVGRGVIYPASFPRTRQRIEQALQGKQSQIISLDVSELQKAEGAVTCCSLIFDS